MGTDRTDEHLRHHLQDWQGHGDAQRVPKKQEEKQKEYSDKKRDKQKTEQQGDSEEVAEATALEMSPDDGLVGGLASSACMLEELD